MTDTYKPQKHISLLAKDMLDFLIAENAYIDKPITIDNIAIYFAGTSRRDIEMASEELRAAGIPLCSSVSKPMGLYLARSYTDALPWVIQISNRMQKMAVHRAQAIKTLKALADRDGIQIEMESILRNS